MGNRDITWKIINEHKQYIENKMLKQTTDHPFITPGNNMNNMKITIIRKSWKGRFAGLQTASNKNIQHIS